MTLTSDPNSPLIFVVDDDRSMRSLLRLAMEEEGYQVAEAKNGEECLAEVARLQPDMILLDAVMPVMDGFSCCQRLRLLSATEHTPVLMITVLDDRDSVDQAFAAGTTDYITKPIHWAVLRQRVLRLLQGAQAMQQVQQVSQRLQRYIQREQLLRHFIQRLEQPWNLAEILAAALTEIRLFFEVQRVIVYHHQGGLITESIAAGEVLFSTEGWLHPGWERETMERLAQGKAIALAEIEPEKVPPQLAALKIQAAAIAPIMIRGQWWGILELHHAQVRQWEPDTIDLLADLAKLIAITVDHKKNE